MSQSPEDELITLISQEQRSLRRILTAGIAALFLVVAMSVALGVYYYNVAGDLKADSNQLERQAFTTRRSVDQQTNRIATQEAAIRRTFEEIRDLNASEDAEVEPMALIDVARIFLQRGGHSLADERRLDRAAARPSGSARTALLSGVSALLAWDRSGSQIAADSVELPLQLQQAEAAFSQALSDPELAPLAHNGLAWIRYELASSPRSNYRLEDCEAVWSEVAASAEDGQLGPQPLYWQAQCERKLGRMKAALGDYALALRQSRAIADTSRDDTDLLLEMNAFHGVGTVLIASADDEEDEALRAARALATDACQPDGATPGSVKTRLAHACLGQAIALRRRLRQTENQVSGSRENISFAYLRDADFQGAFDNTVAVERTGLFAWNELMRALTAQQLGETEVERQARRNVALFTVGQFNLCEIKSLLSDELYDAAHAIIGDEHPDFEEVVCRSTNSEL